MCILSQKMDIKQRKCFKEGQMTLEESLRKIIKELTEILEENKDISDERWYRMLKESRNKIVKSLFELEDERKIPKN
jgi:hypothetical protein